MKNIIDFIEEYDNTITEDLNLILESELIEEGFFGKLKAAWKGLKDAIKDSPSWKAYQEKQKRYAELDKEIEDEYKQLADQGDKTKEVLTKIKNKEEVKDDEKKQAEKTQLDIALKICDAFEEMNKAAENYKKIMKLGKEKYNLKNLGECQKLIKPKK